MRLVRKVVALGTHGHMFCSDSMFHHYDGCFSAGKWKVEDVEEDSEEQKQKPSEMMEVKDQTL